MFVFVLIIYELKNNVLPCNYRYFAQICRFFSTDAMFLKSDCLTQLIHLFFDSDYQRIKQDADNTN